MQTTDREKEREVTDFIFDFFLSVSFQVEQIQAEYKVLALQYHPDKNSGDKEAEAKFQALKVCVYMSLCVRFLFSFCARISQTGVSNCGCDENVAPEPDHSRDG